MHYDVSLSFFIESRLVIVDCPYVWLLPGFKDAVRFVYSRSICYVVTYRVMTSAPCAVSPGYRFARGFLLRRIASRSELFARLNTRAAHFALALADRTNISIATRTVFKESCPPSIVGTSYRYGFDTSTTSEIVYWNQCSIKIKSYLYRYNIKTRDGSKLTFWMYPLS